METEHRYIKGGSSMKRQGSVFERVLAAALCLCSLAFCVLYFFSDALGLPDMRNSLILLGTVAPLGIIYHWVLCDADSEKMRKLKKTIDRYYAAILLFLVVGLVNAFIQLLPSEILLKVAGIALIPFVALHFYAACILKDEKD